MNQLFEKLKLFESVNYIFMHLYENTSRKVKLLEETILNKASTQIKNKVVMWKEISWLVPIHIGCANESHIKKLCKEKLNI